MALSKETIADLKKSCLMAEKKPMAFYFFKKGRGGEPTILVGKRGDIQKEMNDLSKELGVPPTTRGKVYQNPTTGTGLVVEVSKGADADLRKSLKKTFKIIPGLKDAVILKGAPAPSKIQPDSNRQTETLKESKGLTLVKAMIKGDPEAFARRAEKIQEGIDAIEDLVETGVLTSSSWSNGYQGIKDQLDQAKVLAVQHPKRAYAALEDVKKQLLTLRQLAVTTSRAIFAAREEVRAVKRKFKLQGLVEGTSPLSKAFEDFLKKDYSYENLAYLQDVPTNVPDIQKNQFLNIWGIDRTFSGELNIGKPDLPADFFDKVDAARKRQTDVAGDISLWADVDMDPIRIKMKQNIEDPMNRFLLLYKANVVSLFAPDQLHDGNLEKFQGYIKHWRSLGL